MRSLHELYTILYDKIKDRKHLPPICGEISYLCNCDNKITLGEYIALINHFDSQMPNENRHREFLKSKTWLGGTFWWSNEEFYNPINRKAFIKKMVEITAPVTKN